MELNRLYIVEMSEDAMNYLLNIIEPLAVEDCKLGEILEVFDEAYLAQGELELDLLEEVEGVYSEA